MFQKILKCDYEFISPWWDPVSINAKVWTSFILLTNNILKIYRKTCKQREFQRKYETFPGSWVLKEQFKIEYFGCLTDVKKCLQKRKFIYIKYGFARSAKITMFHYHDFFFFLNFVKAFKYTFQWFDFEQNFRPLA